MGKLSNRVLDLVWPHLTGEPEPPPQPDTFDSKSIDQAVLAHAEMELREREAQVTERARNVDTKLAAMLTLTSVLSAVSIAGLTVAWAADLDGLSKTPMYVGLLCLFYIAIQLIRSLWTTVGGLMRRDYKQLNSEQIDPKQGENEMSYRSRLFEARREFVAWNDWSVNTKVSEMAVAHTALRNALTATAVLVIASVATTLARLAL